jgi:cystathionine gamma-lyase
VLELLDQSSNDLYGGTWRLFHRVRRRAAGLTVTEVDASDAEAVAAAITPLTRMIWVETPGNPLLRIADLADIGSVGRERGILTVADNTFASPAVKRPFEFGFDIVVHSVTKYVSGHSDIIGGAAIVRDDRELIDRLRFLHNATGRRARPVQNRSFLALRVLKTLPLRMEKHAANALEVARFLDDARRSRGYNIRVCRAIPIAIFSARQIAVAAGWSPFFLKAFLKRRCGFSNGRGTSLSRSRLAAWKASLVILGR